MKWSKNSGEQSQDILQNQFTAYVTRAVHNRRVHYLLAQSRMRQAEAALREAEATFPDFQDTVQRLLDTEAIRYALKQIRDRERRIVLARVVEEKSLYRPLLLKAAIVNGVLDEDLYQEVCLTFIFCVKKFRT